MLGVFVGLGSRKLSVEVTYDLDALARLLDFRLANDMVTSLPANSIMCSRRVASICYYLCIVDPLKFNGCMLLPAPALH